MRISNKLNFKITSYLALGSLCLLEACTSTPADDAETAAEVETLKTRTVEVINPSRRSFNAELHIVGTAMANQQVMVHAMEGGYVKEINRDIGDYVVAGQIIAELDNPELNRMYQKAAALLEVKKSTYDRLKSTAEQTPDLTPLQVLEEAEAAYLTALAELGAIQDRQSFLRVKAPFSGVITQRFVDNGALVQSGITNTGTSPIVELQQLDPIRLTIPLPESDAGIIKIGDTVKVTFPELPGEAFTAQVSRTAGVLDVASKTMQTEVDIDNKKGVIKPGMYAKVVMMLVSRENVLSLPVQCQYMFQDELFVLEVIDDKVVRTPLRRGLTNKDYFEVLNTNLDSTSMVIIQGKSLVKTGQQVEAMLKTER
ncbi:MAG TPA: efflux RND transporter periplasmic adaptor subunit [Flavobacteriales bacterium]|nr:efflux RND transporter periplasmic adaptor subunit [Flavobacteriales bacterium]HIO68615.1 efflux RND transporter periplasmic adaptor subunit [Flavobacteriales bacterium]